MPRSLRYCLALVGLICLLAACGSNPTGGTTPTVTTGNTPATTSTPATPVSVSPTRVTTQPVPPTQTSCPAAGKARAAVTAPLSLGSHQNIVYLVKEFQGSSVTSTLKRYDVATGSKTEIVKLPGMVI